MIVEIATGVFTGYNIVALGIKGSYTNIENVEKVKNDVLSERIISFYKGRVCG